MGHFGTQPSGHDGQTVRPFLLGHLADLGGNSTPECVFHRPVPPTSVGVKADPARVSTLASPGDSFRLIGGSSGQYRPTDAGEFVGQGDDQDIAMQPF